MAKTVAAETPESLPEDLPLFEPHNTSPGAEESTTSLKAPEEAEDCTYTAVDRSAWANVKRRAAGAGRETPPRRAAVAAAVALSRLLEDSDADSFITL